MHTSMSSSTIQTKRTSSNHNNIITAGNWAVIILENFFHLLFQRLELLFQKALA